jgi:hypothetical protein
MLGEQYRSLCSSLCIVYLFNTCPNWISCVWKIRIKDHAR